jgi:hypothetical protein
MARDPQSRLTDDGARPETSTAPAPEEVMEPGAKQNTSDTDWLSMTTADPAFFLKESGSE